jgi:beta-glucosidase-like glycosyl hydrolase
LVLIRQEGGVVHCVRWWRCVGRKGWGWGGGVAESLRFPGLARTVVLSTVRDLEAMPFIRMIVRLLQVCTSEHLELARDGVRQSVVLAKNTGGALPLSPTAFKAPVVIGPLSTEAGIGCTTYYGSTPCVNTSENGADF